MTPNSESHKSSRNFGRVCEWFSAGCACIMITALAYSALGFESPEKRGAAAAMVMISLIIPAGLSASIAITLRGARHSKLAWLSMLPFVVAVGLGYAGWFRAFL